MDFLIIVLAVIIFAYVNFKCGAAWQRKRSAIVYDPSTLAISLSKIVHYHCKDVPHDIGLTLAKEIERQVRKND